jgi:hypothetical protein
MEFPALTAVAERLIAAEAAYEAEAAALKARGTVTSADDFSRAWREVMQARVAYRDTFTPATVLAVIRHANIEAQR